MATYNTLIKKRNGQTWDNILPITTSDNVLLGGDSNLTLKLDEIDKKLKSTFVNVRDFGAKGDGITNDTSAIQNAINKALTTTRVLYIPIGDYLVDELVIDGQYGLEMFGDTALNYVKNVSRLLYRGTETCLTIKNSQGTKWNYTHHIRNIDVSFKQNALCGIRMEQINESTISNVGIWGFPYTVTTGFDIQIGQITKFDNCTTSWCDNAFKINGADNVNITRGNYYKCNTTFRINYCVGLFITDNWIEGFLYGVYVENNINTQLENLIVQNNSFWQTLEHTQSRVMMVRDVQTNENLYVNAVIQNNMCYFTVPSSLAFELYNGSAPSRIKCSFLNNTVTGTTGSLYSDSYKNDITMIGNSFSSALFGDNTMSKDYHYIEKPVNGLVHTLEVAQDSQVVKIKEYSLVTGKKINIRIAGTVNESITLTLDSEVIVEIPATTFDGNITLTGITDGQKITHSLITNTGLIFGGIGKNLDNSIEHTLSITGVNMQLWECDVTVN